MVVSIVTGASSGIGREFAKCVSNEFPADEMWLISRRRDRLIELEKELGCKCRIFAMDLTLPDSLMKLQILLKLTNAEVSTLVNASGIGRFALSTEVSSEINDRMIDLNVKALTHICFMCIPYMKAGSSIINMGSLSSFQPVPYINVYGSTKAYVLSFTRALNVELKSRGIRCICVCPGWVKTEFFDHAISDNNAITYFNKLREPAPVAKKAMKDLKKGKDLTIYGLSERIQVLATKLFSHKFVMKVWMKQQGHDS
ncbi:MAG: SDR family NAD(P)-dependent oxidoreductase [Lachnospiraceae bacterium]|jgi:short-subunit dehydrogenase|nr:SDR family NAD(P)-dependent oxidoreductase [Lachnospiraceae bacterium]